MSEVPGQQGLYLGHGCRYGEGSKELLEIAPGFQPIRLGRLDQGIEIRQ